MRKRVTVNVPSFFHGPWAKIVFGIVSWVQTPTGYTSLGELKIVKTLLGVPFWYVTVFSSNSKKNLC